MKEHYDIAIIGGGVIGCSIARHLSRFHLKIILIEKGPDVANDTSRANSGVVHAGYANPIGSLKAKLCVQGNRMFDEFTQELGVPFKRVGKLVIGHGDHGLKGIQRLYDQGQANSVPGLSMITGGKISGLESNITADHAMLSLSSGITDPMGLTIALANNAHRNGVDFLLESEVVSIESSSPGFKLRTANNSISCSTIINSAGLFSDRIASMAGDNRFTIHPCRGEYFVVDKDQGHLISRMIYPVPPADHRVLGVHLTPTIDGNILIGPTAEFIDEKLDRATTQEQMRILLSEAKDLLPSLPLDSVIQSFSGIRPKINDATCTEVGDFIIEESPKVPGLINLIGIESPGLTCSPSLPLVVTDILSDIIILKEKDTWDPVEPIRKPFRDMNSQERIEAIQLYPDHGQIICRCEHVTRKEIIDAIKNPIGARSMISVKKRTRAGMGRCQGGFCTPRIVGIMHELGIEPEDITLKGGHSNLFVKEVVDDV